MPDIWFPYLGIEIQHLSKTAFTIGDFSVAWYGIIIAVGVVLGLLLARHLAKKSGQKPDDYTDFLIFAQIFGLIGARFYYVIFEWDNYKGDIASIFNLRNGGLAIYGGVIAALITAAIFCKVRKLNMLDMMDTAMPGLILGQAIGRWGNFFNQEAFGGYTDGPFAMRLNIETAAYTTPELLKHTVTKGGVRYIQVHPCFLYESFFCLVILVIMLIVFDHRKFKGQVACIYMMGYGIIRMFIEMLRTDQLKVWNTNFPVSVFTSAAFALAGLIMMIVLGTRAHVKKQRAAITVNEYAPHLEGEEESFSDDESVAAVSTDKDKAGEEETPDEEAENVDSKDSTDTTASDAAADKEQADEDEKADPNGNQPQKDEDGDKNQPKKKELTDEDLWS